MRRTVFSVALVGVFACSEGTTPEPVGPPILPPPAPGEQRLTVRGLTTGTDPDPDGYLIAIDGQSPVRLDNNGTVDLGPVTRGPHQIRVSHIAPWCRMLGDTVSTIEMRASSVFNLQIQVDCQASFRGLLVYASGTELRFLDLVSAPPVRDRLGFQSVSCAPAICLMPSISPDGQRLAYVRDNTVRILSARTRATTVLITSTAAGQSPVTWSPDGVFVAYVDWTSPAKTATALFRRRSDGSGSPEQLTFGDASVSDPKWSPTGSRIAYVRRATPSGTPQLTTVTPDGGNVRAVVDGAIWPDWSPDGLTLVYGGQTGLRRVNADGTGDQPLAVAEESGAHPVHSRDGTQIAVVIGSGSCEHALAFMASSGGAPVRVTEWQSACGPGGKHLGPMTWGP